MQNSRRKSSLHSTKTLFEPMNIQCTKKWHEHICLRLLLFWSISGIYMYISIYISIGCTIFVVNRPNKKYFISLLKRVALTTVFTQQVKQFQHICKSSSSTVFKFDVKFTKQQISRDSVINIPTCLKAI